MIDAAPSAHEPRRVWEECPMSCLQALLAKLRFEKAEPILKMQELQKVLGHIARDMLARPNLRIKALVLTPPCVLVLCVLVF